MHGEFDLDDNFDSDIDLTPLIDVVFLLIIFFVLATSFSKPVLEVILPSSDSAKVEKFDKGELLVEITKEGVINFDGQVFTEENIMTLIETDTAATMILHIDREAPFNAFLIIIDNAKKINRKNIVVATDEKE